MEARKSENRTAIDIRPLTSITDFEHCLELQRDGFGWSDADMMPLRFFVVTQHIGGLVLGAFDGASMVGFLSSLPGVRNEFSYWHSHILAVEKNYRNQGIGARLKFAQRTQALVQGIRWIEWTFDPLEARNAYFNFEKLGVIVNRYYPNFYGETTGVQGGLPTDRIVAEWWVEQDRTPIRGNVRRLAIHPDIQQLKRSDKAAAQSMQQQMRAEFLQNLADGFHAVAFQLKPEAGEYIFVQGPRVFIRNVELRELRMELVHPFETSFGITRERRIVIVKVSDGTQIGYGEVTAGEGPFYSHETYQTAWHILTDFVIPRAIGRELAGAADFRSLVHGIRGHRMAQAGLETALWDLEAKVRDMPLWRLLGGSRVKIDCGVSIGIQPDMERLLAKIQTELDAGYRRIKIKIKPGWDLQVVQEVRQAFPQIPLMVDANSAYTLADLELFRKLDAFNLMMIEQPLHDEDMIDHAELQQQLHTPICLDESIHSAADAVKAIRIGACRIINIKLGRVGGHREVRALHDVCRDAGIPVWCGGMLESGIGRAHNIALSSLENFSLPGDVTASRRYWTQDIIEPQVEVDTEGRITQRDGSGIGYGVNESLLDAATVRAQVFEA